MEYVDITYGHFVFFKDKRYILWPFTKFCGLLVYFPSFGLLRREKSGNPD
jgi:hypothetical protein